MAPLRRILPSEIARLVYGYLNELSDEISYSFLKKSPYLADCAEIFDEGDSFYTDFKGLTLKELLQEYTLVLHIVNTKIRLIPHSERRFVENGKLPDKLCLLLNMSTPDTSTSLSNSLISTVKPTERQMEDLNLTCPNRNDNLLPETPSFNVKRSCSQSTAVMEESMTVIQPTTVPLPSSQEKISMDVGKCHTEANAPLPIPIEKEGSAHVIQTLEEPSQPVVQEETVSLVSPTCSTPLPVTPGNSIHSLVMELKKKKRISPAISSNIGPRRRSPRVRENKGLPKAEVVVKKCEAELSGGASPRLGVDKETFLNNVELGREADVPHGGDNGKTPQLSRSRSCSDLSLESQGGENRRLRLRGRPKFFTPNKRRCDEPSEEALKATLKELYEDRELHEKLARSINQAREEISITPEADELDEAIQSIIEKTTSDPAFNEIMIQSLSNLDLLTFLKPAAKPVASVKDRLRNAGVRNIPTSEPKENIESKSEKQNERQKSKATAVSKDKSATHSVPSLVTLTSLESGLATAELLPYPEIRYDPADCNIVTGTLDAEGNCVFYSNPKVRSQGIILPSVTQAQTQATDAPRYRNILPKFENSITLHDLHPVVVCTPIMGPPLPPVKEITTKEKPKTKKTSKAKSKQKTKKTEVPPPPPPPSATPTRECTDDMPAINFFATPQPPKQPTPPPAVLPIVTPDAPPVNKRRSLSTPRRKSYIRALEFETPQKQLEEKKSVTSPKLRGPPSGGKTPKIRESSVKKKVKPPMASVVVEEFSPPRIGPPVATRTPVRKKLSEVWDTLTGVSCILNHTSPLKSTVNETILSSISNTGDHTLSSVSTNEISKSYDDTTVISNYSPSKPVTAWDSNLRVHCDAEFEHRKDVLSVRSPKRFRKSTKKASKKVAKKKKSPKPKRKSNPNSPPSRRITRSKKITISPSKMNVTSKRNTYSISHGSSSAFESSSSGEEVATLVEVVDKSKPVDLVEMTPAKDEDPNVLTEETPFTKLLRENITSVDIDLSMIQTPFFPTTPCLMPEPITPIHATRATDYSSSSSYYKPELTSPASCLKDPVGIPPETVEELQRSEEFLQDVTTVSGRNLLFSPVRRDTVQNKITDYYRVNDVVVEKKTIMAETRHEETQSTVVQLAEFLSSQPKSVRVEESVMASMNEKEAGGTINTVPGNSNCVKKAQRRKAENPKQLSKPTENPTPSCVNILEAVKKPEELKVISSEIKINQIVNEGKKILARRCGQGKNMSFLKLQMIAQCDIKLGANIPISENGINKIEDPRKDEPLKQQDSTTVNQLCLEENNVKKSTVTNLRDELETKRLQMVEKIKLGDAKKCTGLKRPRNPLLRPHKRVRTLSKHDDDFSEPLVSSTPNKPSSTKSKDKEEDAPVQSTSPLKSLGLVEKTKVQSKAKTNSSGTSLDETNSPVKKQRLSKQISDEVKKEIPSFVDDGEFPQLNITTKKKLFVIKTILNRPEVVKYLSSYTNTANLKIVLKPCIRKLFKTLFKWLKHPHKHETESTPFLKDKITFYLEEFKKINQGVPYKKKPSHQPCSKLSSLYLEYKQSCDYSSDGGSSIDSSVGEKWKTAVPKPKGSTKNVSKKVKSNQGGKSKSRDDSKVEASLPLKKRKNPAEERPEQPPPEAADSHKTGNNENNVSHAQIILQDIDVDRFLSHVHGHDSS